MAMMSRVTALIKETVHDSIMVQDADELPLHSIDRLHPERWLDMWIIAAAMELTDKPSCVRYGLCVPLGQHEDDIVVPHAKAVRPLEKEKSTTTDARSNTT
jgi:hypothetical protein